MARRLVMFGRKPSEFHTMDTTIDIRWSGMEPAWSPRKSGEEPEPDVSNLRKQELESVEELL